jgi:uncharacterized protein (TIGR02145 family)
MKNKSLLMTIAIWIIAFNSSSQVTGTITDSRDGKAYKTVQIGTQTWMAENLAYKTSNNCYAYDNNESYVKTYGYLYTWETAKTVCPIGWHLPSTKEYKALKDYLGGDDVAGDKLKSTTGWSPSIRIAAPIATNESGFTALPAGWRSTVGAYFSVLEGASFWTSTENTGPYADCNGLSNGESSFAYSHNLKDVGHSVRCIKD